MHFLQPSSFFLYSFSRRKRTDEQGVWSAKHQLRRNLVLCNHLVNVSEKCKFTFFKHPSGNWRTSGCSSSAGKIAAPINGLHPSHCRLKFSIKYGVLLLSTSASAFSFLTQKLITSPLLLMLLRREIILLSSSRSIDGRPRVSLRVAMTVTSVLPFSSPRVVSSDKPAWKFLQYFPLMLGVPPWNDWWLSNYHSHWHISQS